MTAPSCAELLLEERETVWVNDSVCEKVSNETGKTDRGKEVPERVWVGRLSSRKGRGSRGTEVEGEQAHAGLEVGLRAEGPARLQQAGRAPGRRDRSGAGVALGGLAGNLGSRCGRVKKPRRQSCSRLLCMRNLCFI